MTDRGKATPNTTSETAQTTARGLLAHIQPTFLVPAVAIAIVGGLFATQVDTGVLAAHAIAVATAVYIAHIRDSYVDRFVRGEEPAGETTPRGLRITLYCCSIVFLGVVALLWWLVGPVGVLVTVPLWLLAISHAPYLDTGPIGVTGDYAIGISLVIVGGYAVQTGTVSRTVLFVAAIHIPLLAAVKISVDQLDYAFDVTIAKRTLPVVLGPGTADRVSRSLYYGIGAFMFVLGASGNLNPVSLASAPFVISAGLAVHVRPRHWGVWLQILLSYPFTALFVLGLCLETSSACGAIVSQGWHY